MDKQQQDRLRVELIERVHAAIPTIEGQTAHAALECPSTIAAVDECFSLLAKAGWLDRLEVVAPDYSTLSWPHVIQWSPGQPAMPGHTYSLTMGSPAQEPSFDFMIRQLDPQARQYGGLEGTCYQCPFASAPLREDGSLADWSEVSNDPTEAFFTCSLPGRDSEAVAWGEEAPCTTTEWVQAILTLQPAAPPPTISDVRLTWTERTLQERAAGMSPNAIHEYGELVGADFFPAEWLPEEDHRICVIVALDEHVSVGRQRVVLINADYYQSDLPKVEDLRQ